MPTAKYCTNSGGSRCGRSEKTVSKGREERAKLTCSTRDAGGEVCVILLPLHPRLHPVFDTVNLQRLRFARVLCCACLCLRFSFKDPQTKGSPLQDHGTERSKNEAARRGGQEREDQHPQHCCRRPKRQSKDARSTKPGISPRRGVVRGFARSRWGYACMQ